MLLGALVLVHSPLVGPDAWEPVADELRRRGEEALVPELVDGEPFWRANAASVARVLPDGAWLVAWSGAGALLPAIREAAGRPVAGYLFVDAGIHEDGQTRLDTLPPPIRRPLEAGELFPQWTDAELEPLVPDAGRRRRLVAGLRPRGLDFWREPIPVFAGWPDAPCGYLLLSPTYEEHAARARELGWPVRELRTNHFQPLVDPAAVADELLALRAAA